MLFCAHSDRLANFFCVPGPWRSSERILSTPGFEPRSCHVLVWRPDHCASKRVMHTDRWQTTIDLCIYTYRYIQTYYPALHTTHTMTTGPAGLQSPGAMPRQLAPGAGRASSARGECAGPAFPREPKEYLCKVQVAYSGYIGGRI